MNTTQILTALKNDPVTANKFCGVFPSDQLPEHIETFPCGIVANTDPSGEPGTHWITFYLSSRHKAEFFDSFGKPPEYYHKSFKHFLDDYDLNFNNRKLQSIWTDVCGQYCMFYLSHRARGHSMSKIVNMFSNNTMSNDSKVFKFVSKHFKISPTLFHVEHHQSSKKAVAKYL